MKNHFNLMLAKSIVALLLATLLLSCSNNQKFKTVTIGDQVWMAENLNVDKFRNGDPIPHAQTEEEWQQAGVNGQPAWCYYDNDPANGKIYGKLYNWYAMNDQRGLAPEGWRISSDEDWEILIKLLGGEKVAAGKLKEASIKYWTNSNLEANNESGFSALPGGCRYSDGDFRYRREGYWWSPSKSKWGDAHHRSLENIRGAVYSNCCGYKNWGFSVRCVKVLNL